MKYKILATKAGKYLFDEIAHPLLKELKSELITEVFSDNEIATKFKDSVRGQHLFLFAANSKPEDFLELMFTINAAHLAAACKVTVILPYYGYSRQDRQEGPRGCLGAAHMAKMITSRDYAGIVDRVVTIDLHAEQEQGFFNTPCEHIRGHAIFLPAVKALINENTILCSPDAGGTKRVEKYMSRLELPMVTINKRRDKPNEIASMELNGDVKGKEVIIIDDIVDTCGTLSKAVNYLKAEGATKVHYFATHPVLSGKAIKNLQSSSLDTLYVSDTLPMTFYWEQFLGCPEIKIISSIPIIEKVILNLISDNSISELNN
jgi:ribose-phosphate pyrophosphokinase